MRHSDNQLVSCGLYLHFCGRNENILNVKCSVFDFVVQTQQCEKKHLPSSYNAHSARRTS